jgi:hypothetical protein
VQNGRRFVEMQNLGLGAGWVRVEEILEVVWQPPIEQHHIGSDAGRHPQTAFRAVSDVHHVPIEPQARGHLIAIR